MSEPVLSEQRHDEVLHLTLNRPAKRNALSAELRTLLSERLDSAANDSTIGAVLLSGAGDHFCAGFDLGELSAAPDPSTVFADAAHYHRQVHTFPKPLIAAITGSAMAGGLDLALMCDLRLASPEARFGQPQVRHGIPAAYELLATVIGDPPARDLCLTGRIVDGAEALGIGLIHQLVDSDELLETASALASDVASLPGSARAKQSFISHQPALFAQPPDSP